MRKQFFAMNRILVTGASGQLGTELRLLAGNDARFVWTDALEGKEILPLDICDADALERLCLEQDVNTILNLAAYTNVDGAESDVTRCMAINAEAPRQMARIASRHDWSLVQISTDYVFDGNRKRGAYRESDPCHPLSVYGNSKREAELAIRRIAPRGAIIRTAWLYSPFGKNFVRTMLRLGSEKPEISVVADQTGTPTYARDLAAALLKMLPQIGSRRAEIYHFTDEGTCTWFDFAAAIMTYASLPCKVRPIVTAEYPTPATRPQYSLLDKSKIRNDFGVETPWWSTSLRHCLSRISL